VLNGANGAIVGIYGEMTLPQPRIEVLNAGEWSACIEMIDANSTKITGLSLAGCGVGVQLTQTVAKTTGNSIRQMFFSDIRAPMVR
jgi:nitrous oxidase accessory protein NosD